MRTLKGKELVYRNKTIMRKSDVPTKWKTPKFFEIDFVEYPNIFFNLKDVVGVAQNLLDTSIEARMPLKIKNLNDEEYVTIKVKDYKEAFCLREQK